MASTAEKESHRKRFNDICFKGIDDSEPRSGRGGGKGVTRARYDAIKSFLKECDDPKRLKEWKSGNILSDVYRTKRVYSLSNDQLFYQDLDSKSVYVKKKRQVPMWNEVFDIIYEQHFGSSNHRGFASVWNTLKEVWWDITERHCHVFQKHCPYCYLSNPTKKKHKGSNHPIRTSSFRDRFQMDFIDYSAQAAYDFPEEVEIRKLYKFILVVRDHFSRLLILRPLQSKSSKVVAREFAWICNLIGFPLILQTDNGGEVKGEEVVRELCNISPYAHAIQGRPRTPRDQGSVERANRMVKEMIVKVVATIQNSGIEDANWVSAFAEIMSIKTRMIEL